VFEGIDVGIETSGIDVKEIEGANLVSGDDGNIAVVGRIVNADYFLFVGVVQ
jgi:hypothetical protein